MRRRTIANSFVGLCAFVGIALSFAAAPLACAPSDLPAPPYVAQPTKALAEVPYPPPPAHVESIPAAPKSGEAVWIDGEWQWQGRRWAWRKGRWVKPPANASYAPWTTVRDATGVLYVAQGTWRDKFGIEVPEPAPLLVAKVPPVAIIDPSGEQVPASTIRDGTQATFDASISATGAVSTNAAGGAGGADGGRTMLDGGELDAALEDAGAIDADISDALSRPDVIPLSPGATP